MMARIKKRVPVWLILVIAIFLIGVGAFLALGAMKAFFNFSPFGTSSEFRNTQLIKSITREEQVVLLSLGIQGIAEGNESKEFFGTYIPGSKRTTVIQYGFQAKLGIEGKDVVIRQTGEDEFIVSIPEFIFIGHDNENFRVVTEKNGILSWATPEIDSVEMITYILNPDEEHQYVDENGKVLKDQDQYINENDEVLREQAEAFYSGIISSIDPTIVTKFEFRR